MCDLTPCMLLKDKAHGPFPDLRGIAFVFVHYSILSRNGVSGKSGAVQTTIKPLFIKGKKFGHAFCHKATHVIAV